MLKIGIDAMGGDFAPSAIVRGAVMAAGEMAADSRIVLFGDRARIEEVLAAEGCPVSRFDIVECSQVIGFDEHPAQAFSKKPDSSIAVGFNHLKDKKIDGFASAGNTGAMMVGCMYTVKQIEGVIRPAISSLIPTVDGGWALLLDVGLNVDCKPDVLCQYAQIGSVFATAVLGIERPRVGLLNIGEEREKGNLAVRATYDMLVDLGDQINFVGNVEAKNLFTGRMADVVVCDGFVGNTILKMAEGIYDVEHSSGQRSAFIDRFNYETVGGTPVLGINGNVVIAHGCSSPMAVKNMILQTEHTIKADPVSGLREIFVK